MDSQAYTSMSISVGNNKTTAETIDLSQYETLNKYSSPLKLAEREIVGREKEIDALLACGKRPELSNAILLAPAGAGKAIVDTELIAVNDDRNYIQMADVQVGDMVFDENGKPTEVLGVYPQGELDAYEVIFTNGAFIVCNDEHIWNVRNKWGHRQGYDFTSKTLRELMDDGIRRKVTKKSNGKSLYETKWYVPMGSAIERDVVNLPLDPYVVGVLIGDGCLTKQWGDRLVVSSNDEYVVNKVAKILNCKCSRLSVKNYNWEFKYNKSGKNVCLSDLLSDPIFEDSILYKKSIEKSVPSIYLNGSIAQRMALLQGLMDTDGCVLQGYRCNVSFSTLSKQLCLDFCQLASSLGFLVSTRQNERKDVRHKNIEYEVHFCVDNSVKNTLFTLPRHLQKIKENLALRHSAQTHKRYDDVGIKEVRKLNKKVPMTCIYVDSPSHLFQVSKRHVVTHNTSLVQQLMKVDKDNAYLEVDVSKMVAENGADTLGATLKLLFDDVAKCVKETNNQIVLFIDEFHKIINVSESAVEDLKPLLADSGTRGIRVIAATTLEEFNQYISQNQPLVERLQRINVPEPNEEMTVAILKGMAERYGVSNELADDHLFRLIYDYTNRYVPANSQPRKSLTVFDAMLGWHKYKGRSLDEKLLADVIMESEDVNIAFSVDANTIKEKLDKKVLSQEYATWQISDRLQLCVAGLNDPTKPQSTFLFSGSSGVGKTEICKQLAQILFGDKRRLIRFDMTEYANADSLERFRDLLTTRVWEHPYSIILLDEIEKSCGEVTRLLLQVLDDGRLNNRHNREISFVNAYIVMTTNAGSEIYEEVNNYITNDYTGDTSDKEKVQAMWVKEYGRLIRKSLMTTSNDNKFPPELLGRIDAIVPFNPLSIETKRSIVKMKLEKLQKEVKEKHGVSVGFKFSDVLVYLVDDNVSMEANAGGAREAISVLERDVTTKIAKFINENPGCKKIAVMVDDPLKMAYNDKTRRTSEANIKVVSYPVS